MKYRKRTILPDGQHFIERPKAPKPVRRSKPGISHIPDHPEQYTQEQRWHEFGGDPSFTSKFTNHG